MATFATTPRSSGHPASRAALVEFVRALARRQARIDAMAPIAANDNRLILRPDNKG